MQQLGQLDKILFAEPSKPVYTNLWIDVWNKRCQKWFVLFLLWRWEASKMSQTQTYLHRSTSQLLFWCTECCFYVDTPRHKICQKSSKQLCKHWNLTMWTGSKHKLCMHQYWRNTVKKLQICLWEGVLWESGCQLLQWQTNRDRLSAVCCASNSEQEKKWYWWWFQREKSQILTPAPVLLPSCSTRFLWPLLENCFPENILHLFD